MIKVYSYSRCSTCRKALQFLRDNKVSFEEIDITETPPSKLEIRKMMVAQENRKKLLNTSGQQYRQFNIKDKLPELKDTDLIELLAQNGKLIKRPFVIGPDVHLVGFRPDDWRAALL